MHTALRSSYYDPYKVDIPEGEHGTVKVEKFSISEHTARMETMRMTVSGAGYRAPLPGDYTRILRNGRLWMSDTPAEINDHREAFREIERRGGRILINGLGIGMIVHHALKQENVTHIDVVEIDPDVVALVGAHYAQDPRVHIHLADAHEIKWPPGTRWTVAWHDIWETITLDDLNSRARLKRMYGRRVDWQAGWADWEISQQKRADRNWHF